MLCEAVVGGKQDQLHWCQHDKFRLVCGYQSWRAVIGRKNAGLWSVDGNDVISIIRSNTGQWCSVGAEISCRQHVDSGETRYWQQHQGDGERVSRSSQNSYPSLLHKTKIIRILQENELLWLSRNGISSTKILLLSNLKFVTWDLKMNKLCQYLQQELEEIYSQLLAAKMSKAVQALCYGYMWGGRKGRCITCGF